MSPRGRPPDQAQRGVVRPGAVLLAGRRGCDGASSAARGPRGLHRRLCPPAVVAHGRPRRRGPPLPGVMGNALSEPASFAGGLEYPQYTRPPVFEGWPSGGPPSGTMVSPPGAGGQAHHRERRPDLLGSRDDWRRDRPAPWRAPATAAPRGCRPPSPGDRRVRRSRGRWRFRPRPSGRHRRLRRLAGRNAPGPSPLRCRSAVNGRRRSRSSIPTCRATCFSTLSAPIDADLATSGAIPLPTVAVGDRSSARSAVRLGRPGWSSAGVQWLVGTLSVPTRSRWPLSRAPARRNAAQSALARFLPSA